MYLKLCGGQRSKSLMADCSPGQIVTFRGPWQEAGSRTSDILDPVSDGAWNPISPADRSHDCYCHLGTKSEGHQRDVKKKKKTDADLPVLVEKEMDVDRDRGALTQTSQVRPSGLRLCAGIGVWCKDDGNFNGKMWERLKKNTESKMRQQSHDLVFELKSRFMKVIKSDGRSSWKKFSKAEMKRVGLDGD